MARPSLLSPKVQRTICAALIHGHSFEAACELAGIAPSTAYEWCARGEGRDPRRPASSPYIGFAEAVARSVAFAESNAEPQNSEITGADPWRNAGAAEPTGEFAESSETQLVARNPTPEKERVFAVLAVGNARAREQEEITQSSEEAEKREFAESGFLEFSESVARAREDAPAREPRYAPMPWLSQKSRSERSILDMEF